RVYRWAGRSVQAANTYERALRLARQEDAANPREAKTRANYALTLAETGERTEPISEITRASVMAPGASPVAITLALGTETAGNRQAALAALENAARAGHSVAEIRRHPDLARLREDPGYLPNLAVVSKPRVK